MNSRGWARGVLLAGLSCGCVQGRIDESVPAGAPALPDLLEPRTEQTLAFTHPDACAPCHEQHYDEWRITPHAYAMRDPIFRAMVVMGQRQTEGKLGQFCVQCHTPTGLATGQTEVAFDDATQAYAQNLDVDPIGMSGVTCTACHSMTNVVEPKNARVVYTPNGILQGPIQDPVANDFHTSSYNDLFDSSLEKSSTMCGSCHSVVNAKGARIEQTFVEFQASGFNAQGKNCVSCHMPEYRGKAATGPKAPASLPERSVHRHTFVGVDVSLLPAGEFPGDEQMRGLSADLLKQSTAFSASYDPLTKRLTTSIQNLAGHALPSGATAERQMWIELVLRNSENVVVFQSGTLDPQGDLRDGIADHSSMPGSDPQLVYYGQALIAIAGFKDMTLVEQQAAQVRVQSDCIPLSRGGIATGSTGSAVAMPWQADWQCDHLIAAESTARDFYDLSSLPAGRYSASVRLLFRSFPPFFLRLLEAQAGLDPAVKDRVPTVEMATAMLSFEQP